MATYAIRVYPWPTADSPPTSWQGDLLVDDEVIAEFTAGDGGILTHFSYGMEMLEDHLREEK